MKTFILDSVCVERGCQKIIPKKSGISIKKTTDENIKRVILEQGQLLAQLLILTNGNEQIITCEKSDAIQILIS